MANEYSVLLEQIMRWISDESVITMPTTFSARCKQVKSMLISDTSGIINTILDYGIASAKKVKYTIDSSSENLNKILNDWLININNEHKDVIPTGIQELAKEYYSERWKKSSLCILRVHWMEKNGMYLPDALYFVDGSAVKIEKESGKEGTLGGWKYSVGDLNLPVRGEDILVRKPYSGWNDAYPSPYLVYKGVLKNFKGIDMLKSKGNDVLNKIVPYILLLLKGTEDAAKRGQVVNQTKMDAAQEKLKTFLSTYNTANGYDLPVLGFPGDTKLEHLIPSVKNIVSKELFDQGYSAVLAGLGFIEIANVSGMTRRETMFNPKPFIAETADGVEGFRNLLEDIVRLIIDKNKESHRKHFSDNNSIRVIASNLSLQIEPLMEEISKAFPRGAIDYQTYIESMGLDYDTIKQRKIRDEKHGDKIIFYPLLTQNTEQTEDPKYLDEDKDKFITQATEEILGAPYNKVTDLPEYVQKYSKENQKKWMDIWNSAYKYMLKKSGDTKKAEQYAFRVANSRVKD